MRIKAKIEFYGVCHGESIFDFERKIKDAITTAFPGAKVTIDNPIEIVHLTSDMEE